MQLYAIQSVLNAEEYYSSPVIDQFIVVDKLQKITYFK